MRFITKYLIIAVVAGLYVACSPVVFEKDLDCGPGCTRDPDTGKRTFEYTVTMAGAKVDILFVNDNSASMSFEQANIANRFSNFISTLDQRGLDYRIAITTTDVADSSNPPRAVNKYGALQDGNLIAFGNGASFITPSTPDKVTLFANTIRRQETLNCENYLVNGGSASQNQALYRENCPSADEAGIYAANLTIQKNPGGFIRQDSHLAVVFLSDEDVRSQQYEIAAAYRLASLDLPQTLISNVQSSFAGKSVSMHAIIVNPGTLQSGYSPVDIANKAATAYATGERMSRYFSGADSGCLAAQSQQLGNGVTVNGTYGYLYYLAAVMTGGVVGNVCSSDYGSQLSAIGANIGDKTKSIALACENPRILELRYVGEAGTPPGSVQGSSFQVSTVTPGKTVYLKIECPE